MAIRTWPSLQEGHFGLGLQCPTTEIRGYYNTISVPEQELYIPEGEPIFPLKAAADKALKEFNEASIGEENFAPLMLPFVTEAVIERKPRRMYITWKKILDIGPTLDCRGCSVNSKHHKKE